MSGFKLPLALSLTAHALLLALLLELPAPAPPLQPTAPAGGIEVAFAPSLPAPEKPPTPHLPVKAEPPPPPPVVTRLRHPLHHPQSSRRHPRRKQPSSSRRRRRHHRHRASPRSRRCSSPFSGAPSASAHLPPSPRRRRPRHRSRRRRLPRRRPRAARAPSTEISPSYRALLSEWLESHKRYPESAREQGEQGRAVLRFVVERSGRVADFAIVTSSGYPDLDAALERMMRGAILPPFPGRHGSASPSRFR